MDGNWHSFQCDGGTSGHDIRTLMPVFVAESESFIGDCVTRKIYFSTKSLFTGRHFDYSRRKILDCYSVMCECVYAEVNYSENQMAPLLLSGI